MLFLLFIFAHSFPDIEFYLSNEIRSKDTCLAYFKTLQTSPLSGNIQPNDIKSCTKFIKMQEKYFNQVERVTPVDVVKKRNECFKRLNSLLGTDLLHCLETQDKCDYAQKTDIVNGVTHILQKYTKDAVKNICEKSKFLIPKLSEPNQAKKPIKKDQVVVEESFNEDDAPIISNFGDTETCSLELPQVSEDTEDYLVNSEETCSDDGFYEDTEQSVANIQSEESVADVETCSDENDDDEGFEEDEFMDE